MLLVEDIKQNAQVASNTALLSKSINLPSASVQYVFLVSHMHYVEHSQAAHSYKQDWLFVVNPKIQSAWFKAQKNA